MKRAMLQLAGARRDTEDRLIRQAQERFGVERVLRRCGTWAVTVYGVECLTTEYAIPYAQLFDQDWIGHVCTKSWVVADDFVHAYRDACRRVR